MNDRKGFGSNFGFLMAAVGSAVGLGNIWGFPNKMGANGGFPFLILYLALALCCGVIIMLGELALGRKTGHGAVGAYQSISKRFKWLGWLGIAAAALIFSFYSALGGYCLRYVVVNFGNLIGAEFGTNGVGGADVFQGLLSQPDVSIAFALAFMFITMLVVMSGVGGGIERVCSVGMPALFFILIICIIRSCTLPGAVDGLKYMFVPGWAVANGIIDEAPGFWRVLTAAGGQMFFSLSLAMGAMITYGSYLNQKEDLVKNSAIIVFADTLVATMAGIAVIPAAVANGIASGTPLDQIELGGPNLLFVTLQDVFRAMGTVGALFGVIFYLLVLIAAISSAIALIEVDITYFLDRAEQKGRKGNRPKVAFLVCLAIFAVSVLVGIDGLGTTGVFPWPATAGWNDSMLDFVDMLSEGLAMPIGALMMSIMVGWEIRPQTVLDELHIGYTGRIDTFYRICIKYITPIGMLLVLAGQVNDFFSLNWF